SWLIRRRLRWIKRRRRADAPSCNRPRRSGRALELERVGHSAGAATWAAHGDEDALLLLLIKIGTLQQFGGLPFEQLMQRQIAEADLVLGRSVGGCRRRGR